MKKYLSLNRQTFAGTGIGQGISIAIVFAFLLFSSNLYAQQVQQGLVDTANVHKPLNPAATSKTTYPRVVGYLSFILPIVTISNTVTHNFDGATSIGFPVGVNVLYSDKFGFSYEFTPTIKATGESSKMSNLLFDPGTMFRFDHGFTIITRLAFETSGRYGFTPVFNKVYARTKDVNYFIAFSLPARFGNAEAASVGLNVQFGFTFN